MNLGTPHGVAGVAAILALCGGPRAHATVARFAGVLQQHARDTDDGTFWPGRIGARDSREIYPTTDRVRPGWCYGPAGTARALWHAAVALGDPELGRFAVDTIVAAAGSSRVDTMPVGLCHGLSGLLMSVYCQARDTSEPALDRALCDLTDRIVASVDPARRTGSATTPWTRPSTTPAG